jgi:hypothetical protein
MKPALKFGRGHRAFAFELNIQEQEASRPRRLQFRGFSPL